jgi:hypothetical protein
MVEDMLPQDTGEWPHMAGLVGMRAEPMRWAGCTPVRVLERGHRHEALSHEALSASHYDLEASIISAIDDSAVDLEITASVAAVAGARFRGGMQAHSILTGGGILVRPTTRIGNARLAWPTR